MNEHYLCGFMPSAYMLNKTQGGQLRAMVVVIVVVVVGGGAGGS